MSIAYDTLFILFKDLNKPAQKKLKEFLGTDDIKQTEIIASFSGKPRVVGDTPTYVEHQDG